MLINFYICKLKKKVCCDKKCGGGAGRETSHPAPSHPRCYVPAYSPFHLLDFFFGNPVKTHSIRISLKRTCLAYNLSTGIEILVDVLNTLLFTRIHCEHKNKKWNINMNPDHVPQKWILKSKWLMRRKMATKNIATPSLLNLVDTDTVCRNNPYDNCTVINFRKDNLEL